MKRIKTYLLLLVAMANSYLALAQVPSPSFRCLSVNGSGDVTLTWIIPPDPSGLFTRYEIFSSVLQLGPYALAGTVNTYNQTTFLHVGAGANANSVYYYVRTISSGSTPSVNSDTLRSIYLNIGNSANGRPPLSWNKTHTPIIPTGSSTFTLSRQSPPGAWSNLYTGTALNRIDTISICSIHYNYQIETSDASGCVSQSNMNGGLFNDLTPPNIPVLDSVSVNANGTVTIGWEASTSQDATRYVIYKDTGVNIAIDTVNGRFTTTYTYLGSSANIGPETFKIAAMDSCGNISPLTTNGQTSIYMSLLYDLCSRTNRLAWKNYGNLPDGISKYNVYCSVNGAPATIIATTASNAFSHENLTPGNVYCYFVKVINSTQTITANSNVTCFTASAPQGPAYVYIRSVSVNTAKQVEVNYVIDNSRAYKGATIFRSKDGITFSQLSYQAAGSATLHTYLDKDVTTSEKNYYYKIQISDSCGNPGNMSNISKTILLRVSNDNENVFYNTLTWDDYSSWSGGVDSYNIYRAVNGVFDPVPVTNVPYGTRLFVDDVQDFVSDQGKFSYYVQAVEGAGNIYGFKDIANSNPADAYVEVNIFVPNAFSPAGVNKIWLPIAQYVEKTDYKVTVFDRWGTKVFETADDTQGWDGKNVTNDVFVYLIEYKNARGEFIQLKGYITLIR